MPGVTPADAVGGSAVGAAHLEHLAIAIGLPAMTTDHKAVSNAGLHPVSFVFDLTRCSRHGYGVG